MGGGGSKIFELQKSLEMCISQQQNVFCLSILLLLLKCMHDVSSHTVGLYRLHR